MILRVAGIGGSEGRRAFSELYDRYGGLVYGAGLRYLGDRTLAEDLTQDVFLSVWRNAAGFDPARASFSTWLHRVARNRAVDLARRRKVRVTAPVHEDALPGGEDDGVEGLLNAFDVVGALSEISPTHREVLVLAYFEGLSQREISARTGTPLGTVKSRTAAALRAARARLLARQHPDASTDEDRPDG